MAAGKIALTTMALGASTGGITYEAQTPRDEWTATGIFDAMDLGALGNFDPST
jgi:hypothetical protein